MTKHNSDSKTQVSKRGRSKYAIKRQRRRAFARKHGLRDAPWPVLWAQLGMDNGDKSGGSNSADQNV